MAELTTKLVSAAEGQRRAEDQLSQRQEEQEFLINFKRLEVLSNLDWTLHEIPGDEPESENVSNHCVIINMND